MRAHDTKHVLSFVTSRKYRDPSDPSRSSPCSTPAMFTTNKRLLQTNIRALLLRNVLNHRLEFEILWDAFSSQIAELWFPHDRTIAIWLLTIQIAEDRTLFYFSIFADDRRSLFPYDRRQSQNFLRSAIRDRLISFFSIVIFAAQTVFFWQQLFVNLHHVISNCSKFYLYLQKPI